MYNSLKSIIPGVPVWFRRNLEIFYKFQSLIGSGLHKAILHRRNYISQFQIRDSMSLKERTYLGGL